MQKTNWKHLEAAHLCRIDKEKEGVFLLLMNAAVHDTISLKIGRKALSDFYYYTLPVLGEAISIVDRTENTLSRYLPPKAEFRFYLDEEKGQLLCNAKAVYGEEEYPLMDYAINAPVKSGRDAYAETEVAEAVLKYCPQIDVERSVFTCEGEEDSYFFAVYFHARAFRKGFTERRN